MTTTIPRLARRATLIYLATVVVPIGALLWLGLQSFDRQRQAVRTLRAEQLATAVDAAAKAEAASALRDRSSSPIAGTFFVIDRGEVIEPALHSPAPRPVPREIADIERQELTQKRPDLAVPRYQALITKHTHESLARQFLARSLSTLGREAEAREQWRALATNFPDDRDLAGRPYGIVGAINSGDTKGLFEQISSGRWNLPGDQAEYFLTALDPARPAPYLDRYDLARQLADGFRPAASLREGEVYAYTLGTRRLFYRTDGTDRITGLAADPTWVAALEQRLAGNVRSEDTGRQGVMLYGGAIAVLLLVVSAGLVILHRDVSRESRLNQLRSDFVNGVTHELKTPIAIIRLYGETLLQQRGLSDDERRNCSRVISRESARLGRLVDQVLTFSRVERGDERYELHEDDPAPVISGILDDYSIWLEQAGFSLDRDLPASMPPVRFDPSAVAQAVLNLLDNAVKYSGESKRIAVRLAAADGHVTFEVQDHGIGIAPADRSPGFRSLLSRR